ncbi:MAG: extracellular solute-binding protein [Nitriliruptoraceae bacterium]|nr:extracellular solute-binding protein [Nitriliruptoraceae bacterium]
MRTRSALFRGVVVPLAAISLILAACGDGGDDGDEPDVTEDDADEPEGDDDGDGDEMGAAGEFSGTLTVWHNYDEGVPGLFNAMNTWAEMFEEMHPDVTVQLEQADFDGIAQRLIAATVADEPVDVAILSAFNLPELYQADAVQSISDLWEGYEDRGLFPEDVANVLVASDGEQFGTQAFANVPGMYVNLDLLDELGLDLPTTRDEFEAAMDAAADAGFVPFTGVAADGGAGEFNVMPFFASQGWSFADPTGDGLREALQIQQTWLDNGWRSANDSTGFVATDNFLAGDHLFAQDGNWQLSNYIDNAPFEWDVLTIPDLFDGAALGGEALAVGSNAQVDMAWAFITDVMLSEQGQIVAAEALSVPLREGVDTGDADPRLGSFADLVEGSILIPLGDNAGQVSTLIGDAYSEMVAGAITADEAADRIYEELPGLLE